MVPVSVSADQICPYVGGIGDICQPNHWILLQKDHSVSMWRDSFYLSRPWDNCRPCLLWQKRGILNWRSAVLCGKKYRSINETLGHLQLCFQPKNTSLNLLWFRRSRQKISSLSDLHLFPQSAEMSPVAKKHQYSSVRLLLDVYVYVYMYVTSKYYN